MIIDIFDTNRKYDLILADPPWKQSKGGKKSVRENSSGKPLDYQVCTIEEIKAHLQQAAALTDDNSVMPSVGELHYKCVSAIIYRVKNGKLSVSAEIEDKCGHSVTIVDPKKIRYEEG